MVKPGLTGEALALSLDYLDLSNNSFTGTLPPQAFQLANMTFLDLSHDSFTGSLPAALPSQLSVLNLSNNMMDSELPAAWGESSSMSKLRLDNNMLSGSLPTGWADLGGSRNSLQMSLTNASMTGKLPKRWIDHFCLQVASFYSPRTVFAPSTVSLLSAASHQNVTYAVGSPVIPEAQPASINITLGGRCYCFTHQTTGCLVGSVCCTSADWPCCKFVLDTADSRVCCDNQEKKRKGYAGGRS